MTARLAAALLVLAVGLGGCSTDPEADDFLQAVGTAEARTGADLHRYGDDDALVTQARASCNQLDAGASLPEVITDVHEFFNTSDYDAGLVVGLAVGSMCPEHSPERHP